MKKSRRRAGILVAAALVLILCAAAFSVHHLRRASQTADMAAIHQISIPFNTETAAELSVPETVSMELGGLLTVDAPVRCPDHLPAQLPKFRADLQVFSERAVFDRLFSGRSVQSKSTHPAEDGTKNMATAYWAADGSLLLCGSAIIGYETPFSGRIEAVFYPIITYGLRVGDAYYNADRFPQKKDLPFRSVDAVFIELKELFSRWGVELSEEYDCWTLDRETLAEQSRIVAEKKKSAPINTGPTYENYPWSADDECYYFMLRQDVQGIPMTTLWHGGTDDGTGVRGTELCVLYGRDGIEELDCFWTYRFSENSPTGIAEIIPLDRALETLAKQYGGAPSGAGITVTEIEFRYAPCRNGKQFDIIPVWIFKTERMDANIGKKEIHYIFVNAETGEAIE